MKKVVPGPYIAFGTFAAVLAAFVIPLFDMIWNPGTGYGEGFSLLNLIIALAVGAGFACTLWRSDRAAAEKAREAEGITDDDGEII